MKIAVCVKQVPDMESKFTVVDNIRVDESQIAFKMNDFDEFAVEAALQIKEKLGGEVIVVSVGPERIVKDIRQAFAMGADWGIHVQYPQVDAGDSYVVASAIQKAIEKIGGADLILTGVMSEDNQCALTGVMVADMMKLPSCTNVVKLEIGGDQKSINVNRELEGGLNEVLEMPLPAVLSIQSGINQPRYPTLPGIMKAKKKRLDVMTAADLGVAEIGKEGSKTELAQISVPVSEHKAEIIQGDAKQAAAALINKLKNEVKVI